MNIREHLNTLFRQAMDSCGVPAECPALVAVSKKAGFGDYQANGAMGAAKKMGSKPRELAEHIIAAVGDQDCIAKLEVAGPGFINIHLNDAWLAGQVEDMARDPRLGIDTVATRQNIAIDYSAPNLAKEMHVGHLRSTCIGDAMVRILDFLGHRIHRFNHVGDWGTQFGMLIAELLDQQAHGTGLDIALEDLEVLYRKAKQHFDEDEKFRSRAYDYVVRLQGGDQSIHELWQYIRQVSLEHSQAIYDRLNITLSVEDAIGESFYNDELPKVIEELSEQGLAVEDQGATVVFLEEMADKDGKPGVFIVQKGDGGYNYATTDLAAVRYRIGRLHCQRLLYFIDARQSEHIKKFFLTSRKAGFAPEQVSLEHLANGTINGSDGKPYKTRSGESVKLADVLDEAVERAGKVIAERSELSPEKCQQAADVLGIGAVKYAELSKTRTNDYVFDWEQMLALDGNTAPYFLYAYARIRSIFRNAGLAESLPEGEIVLAKEEERALALKLVQVEEVIVQVAQNCYPHELCNYLYELSRVYMKFYEGCPILKDGVDPSTRDSRLWLCQAVAQTLNTGLGLLGIDTLEQM